MSAACEEAPAATEELADEPTEQLQAPPAVLSDQQKEQLLAAIEEMRRATKNVNTVCFGWKLVYTLRKQGGTTRGDMMVIDPADGQKLYSVVSVKRKLGLAAPVMARDLSLDSAEAPQLGRRTSNWDWEQVRHSRDRRLLSRGAQT